MATPIRVAVSSPVDVSSARRQVRQLASSVGLERIAVETLALVVSELATNLVRYARVGEIMLSPIAGPRGVGVEVVSQDRGPGIADVDRALQDGFSTGWSMGTGLPAARRLMDEFAITSGPTGTRIVARKWSKRRYSHQPGV